MVVVFISFLSGVAHAFGPNEAEREKMRQHRALCEKPLRSICGDDLEFPDVDRFRPGPSMFRKIKRIKTCVNSAEVEAAEIPAECKKEFGPK